ncbi:MAG TPA: translesion error-prone DNA polymerase V autoproteolytic subunit [bacterium]|nr:translesion error-prone DNA polymerase V autoproteolytic subunit [bacterium]HPN30985.1 translesion error-prone DNA polymerase V autoproteolytic subunit [bacterium]
MKITEIFGFEKKIKIKLPLFTAPVKAGFPSPAEDYVEAKLDLNEYLVKHPASTFFVRVEGESMIDAGIYSGDILIVDKSLEAQNGGVVIAVINGEFTVKRVKKSKTKISLIPANKNFPVIDITDSMEFEIWGVATSVIHKL